MPHLSRPLNIIVRNLTFIFCAVLVAYVSLIRSTTVESDIPHSVQAFDLPFHIAVYFVVALTAVLALARRDITRSTRLNILMSCALFGALLEIMQATIPGISRTCTIIDFMSNTSGAAIAVALVPAKWLLSRN